MDANKLLCSPRHTAWGIGLMLGSVLLFSSNVLLIKGLSQSGELDIWELNLARCLCGMVLAFAIGRGSVDWLRLLSQRLLLARGIVGGLGLLVFYATLVHLSTGRATTLNLSYTLFASLMAAAFLGEHLSRLRLAGVLAGLAGLPLVTGAFSGGGLPGGYDLLGLLGAIIAGVAVVLVRYLGRSEPAVLIYGAQAFYGIFISLPFLDWGSPAPPNPLLLGAILSGLLAAGGQLCMTEAYRRLSVAHGASLQLLVPVLATLGGMTLFGEAYGGLELAGSLIVLSGCLLSVLSPQMALPRRAKTPKTARI